MIRYKLAVSGLEAFKDLPARAQREFRRELQTSVKPALQRDVDRTLGEEPGPVRHPFGFATDKSRRAFFATKGFGRGLGAPRLHQLSKSWAVEIGTQVRFFLITIKNTKRYAKYVYPPLPPIGKQVIGHLKTGWGKDQAAQLVYLERRADLLVAAAWLRAVKAAARRGGYA